ncbi:hypothetical protein L6164_023081 [Bauhinia variegata]|uniref:Uncharacterized protein n=1 Tax=Bauhinia variegata TaxID=167791 RepID=A0ACB9MHF9_BAUVA|nr:hypothetical protein L6164_023081 [Bauhinia variegata]
MASSSSLDKYVFLITLILPIAATLSSKATESLNKPLYPKVKVEIFNALEGGSNLNLHCQSKDDDLGTHVVQSGQSYQFEFHPNLVIHNTLFYCNFDWPDDQWLHHFDVYDESQDACGYCPWHAHEQYEDCYPYKKSLEEEVPPAYLKF